MNFTEHTKIRKEKFGTVIFDTLTEKIFITDQIGSEILCLVDDLDKKQNAIGRFYGQAPHIDSLCFINNCTAKPGEFIRAKIIGTKDYDLIAEQIDD